ncbi:ABC transporter substrate-binding protein [Pseudarthrobacter sp. R1]|uniref:ABC transporter substrate-binding protein n=1 Tax=Pseudarthrobacter sp. R1 TaxID=2944934 RepID=UPI0021099214|nr:ABC transporter substrate-binding protein [Pseudarthrobacter sp. R1]MCQ6272755.1 ABC transporter substrate-binding protein [Pseudarthrobacter sp. R1]
MRLPQVYDPLVKLSHDGKGIKYFLAESLKVDAQGTKWTVKVRPNARTHDGNPFTAEDVLWNFRRIVENNYQGAVPLGPINIGASRIVDSTTLELAFNSPFTILEEVLAALPFYYMAPRNWTADKPVGTGPFVLDSFKPGVSSSVKRFDGYWDSGKPYLDQITVLNMADETTQVNALQNGQVEAINYLSAQSVRQVQAGNYQVIISKTGAWAPITVRCDTAPFDNPKVREALRLVIDRQQINQNVYGGYGTIANDVFGVDDPLSAGVPPRNRDVGRAKELLTEAGHQNLKLTLITNDVVPAQRSVATLFAAQAKEAGIDVSVEFQTATTFFAQSYLKAPFTQDYWYYVPYLANVAGATLSTAPFNATAFHDDEYDQLFQKAISTLDAKERAGYVQAMQKIDYDRGGNIIPVFYPIIDAVTPKVGGVVEDISGFPLGNNTYQDIWLQP